MVWPNVTEQPRRLEPTTGDPFVQDLNELTATRPSPHPRTESKCSASDWPAASWSPAR
jgi:hypothetical protein